MSTFDDIFAPDDEDVDVTTGESSDPTAGEGSPGSRGNGPSGKSGGDRFAELERKLDEQQKVNEQLLARIAAAEAGGSAKAKGDEPAETGHSIEQLLEHAERGGKEAFEAAVAYVKQEEGNFRQRVLSEMRAGQAQQDTRDELEEILPGASVPGSRANRAIAAEAEKIRLRRPSIDPQRAWDLAVVRVANGVNPASYSNERRLQNGAGSGAASGGDRDPGSSAPEFTKKDEEIMRRMNPNSRVFSNDPKVRAAARKAFLRVKGRLAQRATPGAFTRDQFRGEG